MKEIALIAHLSEISGAGVALLETAVGLSGRFKVHLVLPGEGPLASRARDKGVDVVIIENPQVAISDSNYHGKLKLIRARRAYIKNLQQFLRNRHIRLAYVNTSASIFPGVAARLAGVPILWHIHETLDSSDRRTSWKKRMIRQLADGLVYASKSAMEHLSPPNGVPAIIARNYVPVDAIARAVREERAGEELQSPPQVLMNGTFFRKGADVLLHAIQFLDQRAPEIKPRVEIAGPMDESDPFLVELREAATEPDLKGRVAFSGLQPNLVAPLAQATAFVSASRNEALPISIVEAMAASVPVVATDVGDCAELLCYGKCGWVVPPQTPTALAAALEEVFTQPDLVHAKVKNARDQVAALYHAENFWEPIVDMVEKLAK